MKIWSSFRVANKLKHLTYALRFKEGWAVKIKPPLHHHLPSQRKLCMAWENFGFENERKHYMSSIVFNY